jgi:site-specific DNA recombinase
MVYSHARKNDRRYPYYVCLNAQRKGWAACPSKSLPARAIEESALNRLREAQPAGFGASEWEQTDRNRQVEVMQLLVERVGYDGTSRQISIRLRPVPIPAEEVSA